MSDDLRTSDAERETAVARLREASAEGRLTLDELALRTGSAYAARTRGELVAVTADLPAPAAGSMPARGRSWPGIVVGIFAPVSRRKRWRLRKHTVVLSVFAPTKLDLRAATFGAETATITILNVFAPVTVVVPEHVEVDVTMLPIFAPLREVGSAGDLSPAAPRVRIVGVSVFAPTFVRHGGG